MANSFLDYLADSDEEALGPVPPRKKLASTAPGASRGNAIALPGIVATARSVTRAADRLEKDRTPQPRPGIFDAGAPGPVFGSDLTGQVDAMVRQQEQAPEAHHPLLPSVHPDAATWVQPKTPPAQGHVGPFQGTDEDYQRGGERFEEALRRRAEFERQSPQMRVAERFAGGAVDGMFMGRTHQLEGLLDPTRTTADYDLLDSTLPKATGGEAAAQTVGKFAGSALPFVAGAGLLRAAGSKLPEAALAHLAETGRAGRMALAAGENAGFGALRRGATDDPDFLRHMGTNAAIGAGFGALTPAPEAPVTESAARRAAAIAPPELAPAARDLLGVVREGGNPQSALDIQRPNWMDFGTRANLGDLLTPNAGRAAPAGLANVVRQVSERRRAARAGFSARMDDALGVTAPREVAETQIIRPETNVFGVEPGTTTLPRSEGPSYGVRSPVAQSEPAGETIASSARSVRTPGATEAPRERVAAAGVDYGDGQIHAGGLHREAFGRAGERQDAGEFGFITNRGRFVSYQEAAGMEGMDPTTFSSGMLSHLDDLEPHELDDIEQLARNRWSSDRDAEIAKLAVPAPRPLLDRLVSPVRNETGATGNVSALNTSVGEAIRRAPVDSAPRSQWTRYLDDEFDRWLTDGNEGSDIGKAHPDERLWAELDERMSQRFKSNQPVTRRDLLNLLAESETRGIEGGRGALALPPGSAVDRGAAALRPVTALAGAGLGAAGGAAADPEHSLKGAAEGALLGGIAGTAAPSLLARLARSGESAGLPPLPRKGTVIQTWDGRPIEILGRGRRGQVRARWEGREVDLPWASVHRMTLPQPTRRAVPEITDPAIPDVSPGAPAYTETGGLDALARGEDVGERPLLTMRHRYNPDYTATLHLEHAGDRPRFVVREHGGTSPRVLDFDTEEQATTAARTMGFATEGPTDAPLPGQSAEDFRNQVQASAVAGLRGDRPGGFRTRPPTPAGPAKGAPLPLPPLHPALDPEAVRPVWDTVSGRYPRLASLIRGIGVEARRGVGAGYDGPERALFLRADRDPALHFVFHELAHAAQYARGKLGEFRSDDVGLLTEMEDYAYRMGRAYDAAKGGSPPPGADPIDHLMYRMALGAVGGGVGGAAVDREHNRLASGLEGAAAGALLQGAGELVPSAVRAVSNRVGAVGDDITRAMRQEDLPRSLQGGIPRDLRTPPLQRAYLHGISAGESGLAHDFNNFPIGTPEWRAAERGWNATRPRERTVSERASSPVRNETGAAGAEAPRRFVAMPAERGKWRVIDSADGSVAEEVGGIGAQRTAEALAKRYDVERGVVAQADSGPLAGSRVVDESGVPKVVYHGTSKGFGEFDPAQLDPDAQYGPGYYFTENPAVAGDVGLGGKAEFGYATPREGASDAAPNVRPARLGIRNPFDIDATYSPADLHTLLEDVGADPDGIAHALNFVTQDGRSTRRLTGDDFYEGLSEAFGGDRAAANAALRKAGYDGITHIGGGNTGTDPHRVWIAFDRPQIRSAFGPATTAAQTGSTGLAMMRASGGAGLGGLYGYATGDPDNEASRTARALGFAAAGAGLALAPEVLQSIRRVSGNDVGAVGDVGGMADPERALYDALNKRGHPPAPRDLAALASGEMEPATFARTYGVSRRVAKNYAEHVRTLSDPEGYRSPLDSDEFTHDRPERDSFAYQQPPDPAPIDGVPDDGFLPSDAPPRKYGASEGQMGARVFQPGIANRVVGAAVAGTGGAVAGALLNPDDRAGGALRWGAAGAGAGALGLNPESIPMLRRSTMLMNAAGRIRDVASNIGMGGSETSAELIGTGVDALLDYLPGLRGRRTMAFNPTAVAKAAYEGLTTGTADMGRAMVGKQRLHRSHLAAEEAASASVEGAERVVMSNPVLDAAVRVTGRFAGSVDSQAAVFAYEKSIASQARTIALNERIGRRATRAEAAAMEARLRAAPTDEMKVLAASAVAHATFTNESVMSRILAGMREATFPNEAKGRPDLPWARAGLDFIAPFRRVPGAVAGKVLEYSPLGAAKMTRDAVRLYKLASAGADPALIAEARRSFAMTTGRVGTGATTIALGAALGEQGLMTGVHLTQAQKNDGARPFSVKIAGRWWPLGMMGPTGAMLAVGAELHNRGTGEAAAALGENVADATLMRGMGDVRAAVSNPDKAERYAASAAASFVPPIVGQVARIIDPVQRKPDGVLQTVEARIPFASRNVPARTDNFGREVREAASLPGRVALALFDGVHSVPSRGGRDAVQDRLTRMGVNVGSVRRKTAETEQEFAERISDYPDAPHREDETDAEYRRRAATWNRPRPAETDAEFRQRKRDLGASLHANVSALFARRAPEDEYLNDKWTAYRSAEATVREAHPNLRGPAFQRAVEAERRKVVASLIAGTKHSFAVAGDEDPRTYLSP